MRLNTLYPEVYEEVLRTKFGEDEVVAWRKFRASMRELAARRKRARTKR